MLNTQTELTVPTVSIAVEPLLEIRDATVIYGAQTALHAFSLKIPQQPATITTIAGESGSGKTTLANGVLGFTVLTSGQILYMGQDVATFDRAQQHQYRREVQAIFQDPYEVYNPFYRVRHIFDMAIRNFQLATDKDQGRARIEDALQVVGLRGDEVLSKYPHQLSGGQRQRLMIARAYLLKPRLIVADEPVSMVDASLRATILDIMLKLREEYSISFLYITHDLSTAYQIGNDIYVLYRGETVEKGDTVTVIDSPKHPYVQLLVESIPVADPTVQWNKPIEVPTDNKPNPHGCRFYDRCVHHTDICLTRQPDLYSVAVADHTTDHSAACYLYDPQAMMLDPVTHFTTEQKDSHS